MTNLKNGDISFSEVIFPKDFRESVMNDEKKYDLKYLVNRGFVIAYCVINHSGTDESINDIKNTFVNLFKEISKRTIFIDFGNSDMLEYFNEILFENYDLARGMDNLSPFSIEIFNLILLSGAFFSKSEDYSHMYGDIIEITAPSMKEKLQIFVISNKKKLVEKPLLDVILDGFLKKLNQTTKNLSEGESTTNINNGIMINGNNNNLENIQFEIQNTFYEPIIKMLEKRDDPNKKEIVTAVKEVQKKGKSSKSWDFIQKNAPWIIPLLNTALQLGGVLGS